MSFDHLLGKPWFMPKFSRGDAGIVIVFCFFFVLFFFVFSKKNEKKNIHLPFPFNSNWFLLFSNPPVSFFEIESHFNWIHFNFLFRSVLQLFFFWVKIFGLFFWVGFTWFSSSKQISLISNIRNLLKKHANSFNQFEIWIDFRFFYWKKKSFCLKGNCVLG